jgi:hypothetical protein
LETIAHRYDQIFQEVYDESGTVHRRPLPILKNQDGCNLNDGLFLVRVRDAVHSCDKLQWLLEDVHVTHLRIGDGDRAEPSMAQLVVARKAVELCRQKAAVLLAERHRSWEQFVPVKRAIEEAIDGVSALLRLVCFDVAAENINAAKPRPFDNELLLLANRLRDEEDWREALKRLRLDPARFSDGRPVFRLSTHGELCPTSGKVVRTLWDGLTVPVVRHILCNVLHSDTCSPDPWQSEAGTADMWMRVTYHTHCTVLTLANSVSPGTPLQTPTLPTPTEDLGVQIRPALRARCWYTHLALPYLGQSQYLARTDVLKECWRMEALND